MKAKRKKLGVLAVMLVSSTNSVEASRWHTTSEYDDPITGCHWKNQTCVQGFGFAFCEVGSTRTIMTCPPAGNPGTGGNDATIEPAG